MVKRFSQFLVLFLGTEVICNMLVDSVVGIKVGFGIASDSIVRRDHCLPVLVPICVTW